MNYAELNLSQAQVFGNVELKATTGALPQRLTIEKLINVTPLGSGNAGTLYPKICSNGYLYVTRGWYGGNPTIREILPSTMEVLRSTSDSIYQNYYVLGFYVDEMQQENLLLWRYPNEWCRISLSTFETIVYTTNDIDSQAMPIYCEATKKIYALSVWGGGCGIKEIDPEDFSTIETFGTTKINTYASFLHTTDGVNFYWGYVSLHLYNRGTDTDVDLGKGAGSDLTNVWQGYGTYGGLVGSIFLYENDFLWAGSPYILRYDKATLVNKEVFCMPCKFKSRGGVGIHNFYYSSPSYFELNADYWFISLGEAGGGFYASSIYRIAMGANKFASSYAEWTISGSTGTLKKIVVKGGFNRGYGENYADGQQIKVEYYTDHWIEYDIDVMPDINLDLSAVSKLRIGLQERAFFNDRFPYVSKVGLLYEPAGDTTPPAKPTGLSVDEPPARPSGLSITASGGGGGGQTK